MDAYSKKPHQTNKTKSTREREAPMNLVICRFMQQLKLNF